MEPRKARVVAISGPTASGKDTILREMIKREPDMVRLVTATTRMIRAGEREGVDYLFFSKEKFYDALATGLIPEHRHIEALDTDYGLYLPELDKQLATGKTVIVHLDIIGARYLKEHYDALTIFITADSMEETKRRIKQRQHMSDEELEARLRIAEREIKEYGPWYDKTFVNRAGKLDETVGTILTFVRERGYLD
jgi:guanylate kinase